jgi:hypothetical protein
LLSEASTPISPPKTLTSIYSARSRKGNGEEKEKMAVVVREEERQRKKEARSVGWCKGCAQGTRCYEEQDMRYNHPASPYNPSIPKPKRREKQMTFCLFVRCNLLSQLHHRELGGEGWEWCGTFLHLDENSMPVCES